MRQTAAHQYISVPVTVSSFQDSEDLIEFYKARVKYFYEADVESVDFANIEQEMVGRLNQQTDLVSASEQQQLSAEPPLALLSGNFFQVCKDISSCESNSKISRPLSLS